MGYEQGTLESKKHRLYFEEASTAFRDPLSKTIEDPLHSENEEFFVLIGRSIQGRLWLSFIRRGVSGYVLSAPDWRQKGRG